MKVDYRNQASKMVECLTEIERGSISDHIKLILQRLNIDEQTWLINTTAFESVYQNRFSKRAARRQQAA